MTSGPGIGARAPETIAALQGQTRERPRRFGSGRIVSWIVFALAIALPFPGAASRRRDRGS